jgi:hypothetical protein
MCKDVLVKRQPDDLDALSQVFAHELPDWAPSESKSSPSGLRQREIVFSRAGGDRTHDRGIMRWEQTVGVVRWCRIGPVVSVWYVG